MLDLVDTFLNHNCPQNDEVKTAVAAVLQYLDVDKIRFTLLPLMQREATLLHSSVFGMPTGPGAPPPIFVQEAERQAVDQQDQPAGEDGVLEIVMPAVDKKTDVGGCLQHTQTRKRVIDLLEGDDSHEYNEGGSSANKRIDRKLITSKKARVRGVKKHAKPPLPVLPVSKKAPPADVEIICIDDSD